MGATDRPVQARYKRSPLVRQCPREGPKQRDGKTRIVRLGREDVKQCLGSDRPVGTDFVFMLVAAAYRWGLRETVGTAAACLILLL
jgi:hypothetical protein